MAGRQLDTVLRHLHRLVRPPGDEPADGQLLERYAAGRDGDAFAALVERHGPMVLGVCRRVLRDGHDAEDAFQATFFVLAKKAGALDRRGSVGGWLHTVAYHLALKAKAGAARRRAGERQVAAMPRPETPDADAWRELRPVLDAELDRLPAAYRAPLVLCYLEGQTQPQAARRLGLPVGTVKSRIARARELLRRRLSRRGLALPAGLLGAAVAEHAAAAVPAALAQTTVRDSLLFRSGKAAAAGVASARAAALAKGALQTMLTTRIKLAALALLTLAAAAAGVGLVARQALAERPPEQARAPEPNDADRPGQEITTPARADAHGDPLPDGALARLGTVRFRNQGRSRSNPILSVAFTPDGKALLADGVVWDVATGLRLPPLLADLRKVGYPLALSPDCKVVVAGKDAGDNNVWVRLREAATGRPLPREDAIGLRSVWAAFAFSPDGKTLAVGDDDRVSLWELATGTERGQLAQGGRVLSLAFSPDGRALATLEESGSPVRLWDLTAGTNRVLVQAGKIPMTHLAFSPAGGLVAVADDKGVLLCDVNGGDARRLAPPPRRFHATGLRHDTAVSRVAFAPDGKLVASYGRDNMVRLWDVATGKELWGAQAKTESTPCLAFSPDGKTLAAGGDGPGVRLWDVATGQDAFPSAGHKEQVLSVAFAADGRTLVSVGEDHTVRFWDVAARRERRQLGVPKLKTWAVAVSPDGKTLALAVNYEYIQLVDAATGEQRCLLDKSLHDDCVAFSPDGKTLVTADRKLARLWDAATGKELRRFEGHEGDIFAAALSPDGATLATASRDAHRGGNKIVDHTLRLWDVATGKERHKAEAQVQCLTFAPDGRVLATGDPDGKVHLWDVATGGLVRKVGEHAGPVLSLAFAADGQTLAATGKKDGVSLWEVATGRERGRYRGPAVPPDGKVPAHDQHLFGVTAVAFAPDGRTLASASADTTIVLWDVTGQAAGEKKAAPTEKELEQRWEELAGDDAAKAYRAIWALAGAPEQAVRFLAKRLKPAAPPAGAERIPQLVKDLDSDDFATRQKATEQLEKLGPAAEPALREVLQGNPPLEVRQRVEQLLQKLVRQDFTPEELRAWRALEVLEHVGSPEAKKVLEALAKGSPESRLTQGAKDSLRRLAKRAP